MFYVKSVKYWEEYSIRHFAKRSLCNYIIVRKSYSSSLSPEWISVRMSPLFWDVHRVRFTSLKASSLNSFLKFYQKRSPNFSFCLSSIRPVTQTILYSSFLLKFYESFLDWQIKRLFTSNRKISKLDTI